MRHSPRSVSPLLAACALLSSLACSRFGPKPSEADCAKACERVSFHETAKLKADEFPNVHEHEERVEVAEEFLKKRLAQFALEEKEGLPRPDPKQLAALSPARRASVLEAYKDRVREADAARKNAVVRAHADLKEVEDETKKVKKESAEKIAKAVSDSVAKCLPTCRAGSLAHVQCLQRTQSIEDLALCAR
jgi:hypothetical protein